MRGGGRQRDLLLALALDLGAIEKEALPALASRAESIAVLKRCLDHRAPCLGILARGERLQDLEVALVDLGDDWFRHGQSFTQDREACENEPGFLTAPRLESPGASGLHVILRGDGCVAFETVAAIEHPLRLRTANALYLSSEPSDR